MTNGDVALDLLRRGWRPLPLCWPDDQGNCSCGIGHRGKSVGKAPLVKWKDVEPTGREVTDWWRRWPSANVGLLLEPSGLLFIDPDSSQALAEAEQLGLPETVTRQSRNRGYLYLRPDGCPAARVTHKGRSRQLDIMTAGYAVVCGRHRTGVEVRLAGCENPAEAPSWAVEMLEEAATSRDAIVRATDADDGLPSATSIDRLEVPPKVKLLILGHGIAEYPSRSEALFCVLCALVRLGLTDQQIEATVLANPIGEKAREKDNGWLSGEIARARAKHRNGPSQGKTTSPIDSGCQEFPHTAGWPFKLWKHDELLAAEFPEERWVVEDTVPEGALVVLGGKKKVGKSWLALQMAQAVACGDCVLGHATTQGSVLYLCLEDGERRLNQRLHKQGYHEGLPIRYVTGRFTPLDSGGLEVLDKAIQEFSPRLVVIDTLAAAKTRKTDENAAGDMGDLSNSLRDMAQRHCTAIVLVAHHGKGNYGDPGHDLRGSSALAAAADVNLGLYKTESGHHLLRGEGRDIEPFELRIEFDARTTWRWQVVGDARQMASQEAQDEIATVLGRIGEADASTIAAELDKSRQSIQPIAKRMEAQGVLSSRTVKVSGGTKIIYRLNNLQECAC